MSDESLQKLKGCLITMWRDATTQKDAATIFDKPGQIVVSEGKTFHLGRKGVPALISFVEELHKDEYIKKYTSREHLERSTFSILANLIDVDEVQIQVRAEEALLTFINELRRAPLEWIIIVSIANLRLKVDELTVGKVSFRSFTEDRLKTYMDLVREANSRFGSPSEIRDKSVKREEEELRKHYSNKAYAEVNLQALDKDRAKEAALEYITLAINALRLYACGLFYRDFRGSRPYLNMEGLSYRSMIRIRCFQRDLPLFTSLSRITGYFFEVQIGDQQLELMEKHNFTILNEIMRKTREQHTEFESNIITAVSLFGIGTNDENDINTFINLITALESMTLRDREPKKFALAERVAFLLGETYDERLTIFNDMKRLYQKRSDMIHSGELELTRSELYLLAEITYKCIVKSLEKSKHFKDVADLVTWVDKEKFS